MPNSEPDEFDPIDPTPLTMIKQSHPSMFAPVETRVRKVISLYGKPNFEGIHITPDSDFQSGETTDTSSNTIA